MIIPPTELTDLSVSLAMDSGFRRNDSETAAGDAHHSDASNARETADFHGATVAQFESRFSGSMESLIRRHGGNPWLAPALSEVPITNNPAESRVLDQLVNGNFDLVVLLTGVGTGHLFDAAERAGQLIDVQRALNSAAIVCRGPKPVFALRQRAIKPRYVVAEPHTTPQLLALLAGLQLAGQKVLIVSAGEQMPEPSEFLRGNGAHPVEIQLYRWDLTAADAVRLSQTVHEIIAGRIDSVAFTTQVQIRHLFDVATHDGERSQLAEALRARVLVGAVGPTCADALRERGVEPDVVPAHPKMGHLVQALARAFDAHHNLGIER